MYAKRAPATHRALQRSLTVGELIERLKTLPEDARVMLAHNHGDTERTLELLPVTACGTASAAEWVVRTTSHSESGLAIEPLAEDESGEGTDAPSVAVLNLMPVARWWRR